MGMIFWAMYGRKEPFKRDDTMKERVAAGERPRIGASWHQGFVQVRINRSLPCRLRLRRLVVVLSISGFLCPALSVPPSAVQTVLRAPYFLILGQLITASITASHAFTCACVRRSFSKKCGMQTRASGLVLDRL